MVRCHPHILFAMLAFALAGCASRPDPALRLVAPAQMARQVPILVATTRRPSEDPALLFNGERSLSPRLAHLTISVPQGRKPGEILWPSGGKPDPASTFAATRFETVPRDGGPAAIRQAIRAGQHRHVLVFVHGYNTRFDEAAFRLAQIVHDSSAPVLPVLFSWPSWGALSAYPYDRESAATARDGLESVLTELARHPDVAQVSVLAHSMGGWLTLESLRQMAIRHKTIFPKITDVMLAAPDVDVDVALAQGRAIQAAARKPRVTLFVSADDRALNASRLLWGSRDRLGSLDPTKEPYRTNLERSGVDVFDLTSAESGGDSLNHGKFATAPQVVSLIGKRLAGGQRLQGETGAGESASGLAQGTARVLSDVLTTPLRLGEISAPGPESSGEIER